MAISQRYKTIANGHMILTGNTLMLYQQNIANGGAFTTVDTSLQAPGNPAGTTLDWQLNSSMAVLTIPPTATVKYAELTWSSLMVSGGINYSAFTNDPADFTTPASSTPVPVAVQFLDVTNNIATRSADVTALVQAGGSGQYTLGRVAGVNGIESTGVSGNAAGWYLTVIVEDMAESSKLFQVNVGNIFVPGNSNLDFSVSGFSTPASGPVSGRLFAGIQRGDPVADDITIFTGPSTGSLNYQLSRPPLPNNNMIAGFISNTETGALIDTSGTFGNNNNIPGNPPIAQPFARWHIDIATFDVSPSLSNSQTTFVTRSTSNAMVAVFDYNVYNLQIDTQSASITTTKTADLSYAQPGDVITYTIVATNSGTIQADDVIVTDTPPAGTTFVPGSVVVNNVGDPLADIITGVNVGSVVSNGGTATITFQATVDQIPVPNPLVNTAQAEYTFLPLPGEDPMSGTSTSTEATTQVNEALVSIVKSVDLQYATIGDILTYTLTLQNTGNVSANNVVITDAVPSGTSFVVGSLSPNAIGTPPNVSLINSIPPDGTAVVTFQVQVDSIPTPNLAINSATAGFTFTVDPQNPNDSSGTTESNEVSTTLNSAALTIYKEVDLAYADLEDIITYSITVENTGNVPANNVILTDAVPVGTTFVPGSLSPNATGTPPTLTLVNSVEAGETTVVTFQVQVGNTLPVPNPLLNSATANFTYTVDPAVPDGATGTATSDEVSTQVNHATLAVVKTVDKEFADVEEILTYTLTIQNTGNVESTDVVITDPVPVGTSYVLGSLSPNATGEPPTITLVEAVPAGGTIAVTYQVQVGDIIPVPNPVLNEATVDFTYAVDPDQPGGATGTANSTIAVTQVNHAQITTVKEVDLIVASPNDVLNYTLTLTNTGNTTSNNVVITDSVPIGTTFVAGSLSSNATGTPPTISLTNSIPPGDTSVVTFQVQINNGIPNPNPIINIASVDFTYTVDPALPNGASGTSDSNTTETFVAAPILVVEKGSSTDISYLGETFSYTITIENTGNLAANLVTITDPLPMELAYVAGSISATVPFSGDPTGNMILTNPVAIGEIITISFDVIVIDVPVSNASFNQVYVEYSYTKDPEFPNGVTVTTQSNIVKTCIHRYNFMQASVDLIQSIAMQETALSHILNAEGEKIQAALAVENVTEDQLLAINKSVEEMVKSVSTLEMILQNKASIVKSQIICNK